MRRRIEKENNYAASKNVRFGEWESVQESSLPAPTSAPVLSQKAAIPDAEATEPKNRLKKRSTRELLMFQKNL